MTRPFKAVGGLDRPHGQDGFKTSNCATLTDCCVRVQWYEEPFYFLGASGTGKSSLKSFTVNFYLGLCNELFKAVEYPRESVELYDFQRCMGGEDR